MSMTENRTLGRAALAAVGSLVVAAPAWGGTTELVSVNSKGVRGNGGGGAAAISGDGRFVAFTSNATNLVPGDTNDAQDVFVRDRQAGTTERVSVSSTGRQADGDSGIDGVAIS